MAQRDRLVNILILGLTSIACLSLAELGMRALTAFPIHSPEANRISDPTLGYRLSASFPGVDSKGFRSINWRSGGSAKIAAIGDSHTFGYNVPASQSWPSVLARQGDFDVYNFGVGSFGVYTYYALARRAIDQDYDWILIGFFPANDFAPIASYCEIDFRSQLWTKFHNELNLTSPAASCDQRKGEAMPIRTWLKIHSALFSFLDYMLPQRFEDWLLGRSVFGNTEINLKCVDIERLHCVRERVIHTHSRSTDLQIEANRRIFEDARKMLYDLSERVKKSEKKIGAIIIPSKERVLFESARRKESFSGDDKIEIRTQMALENRLKIILDGVGIDYEDATPYVTEIFDEYRSRGQVFYPDGDGHPLEAGYKAYAMAAKAVIEEMR